MKNKACKIFVLEKSEEDMPKKYNCDERVSRPTCEPHYSNCLELLFSLKRHRVATKYLSEELEDFSYEFEFLQVHDTSFVFLLKLDEIIASLDNYGDM